MGALCLPSSLPHTTSLRSGVVLGLDSARGFQCLATVALGAYGLPGNLWFLQGWAVSYLAEAKYVLTAPVPGWLVGWISLVLLFSVLLEVNFELFLFPLHFPGTHCFQVRILQEEWGVLLFQEAGFFGGNLPWLPSLVRVTGQKQKKGTEGMKLCGLCLCPLFHCLDLLCVFLVMDPICCLMRFAVKCTRLLKLLHSVWIFCLFHLHFKMFPTCKYLSISSCLWHDTFLVR